MQKSRNVMMGAVAATAVLGCTAAIGAPFAQQSGRTGGPPVQPLPRPRDFVARVDNPYLPFERGMRWTYEGRGAEQGERNVVEVLDQTKTIEGIEATVVLDRVWADGELSERTHDWYAQDVAGNVWYLGEATTSYDGGTPSHEGSWQAGRNGARAGIVMPADPVEGRLFRQEYDPGNAEDEARVLGTHSQVTVPAGHFDHVRLTEETTPVEPRADELKFFAKGVGMVMEVGISPEASRSVLVRMSSR